MRGIGPGTTNPKRPQTIHQCPVTLQWKPVSDPSGVVYYVRLEEWDYSTQRWQLAGSWYPVSGTQVTTDQPSQCDYTLYRWHVMAEDGAGNVSAWSEWMYYEYPVP